MEGCACRAACIASQEQSQHCSHGTASDACCAQGSEVCRLVLPDSAHIFICGDGADMAKDVHAALLDILQEHGGKSAEQAASHLSRMLADARYIRDIWS